MASTGVKGLDAPMIGAPVGITLDGIVERESGHTPPPPPISVKAVAIALVVMVLLGLGLFAWVRSQPPPDFGDIYGYSYLAPGPVGLC